MMCFDPTKELLPGLPAYEGGRMSDDAYDTGLGRYGRYNDGKPMVHTIQGTVPNWLLTPMPAMECCGYAASGSYQGETFPPVTFSNGETSFVVERTPETFTILQTASAYPDDLESPSLLRAVTETDGERFQAYLAKLNALGYATLWRNQMEDNLFLAMSDGAHRIYASFYPREGVARFVQDDVSTPIEAFGNDVTADGTFQVCQFGLYYSYMRSGRSADCGMLYIVKLPDNSLFLVDGGEMEQATEAATEEILRIMRKMTGAEPGQKMRIAAWFCTHFHDDHTDMFCKLLRKYSEELDVERVIFNFPANSAWVMMPQMFMLKERLHKYCPNAKFLKCHTGQTFHLAGVKFEILQTHEDYIRLTGKEASYPNLRDPNDTSTVMKLSYQGATFLLTGDINQISCDQMLGHFSGETLRATAVQVAHHLINNLPQLYPVVDPEIALVPQSVRCAISTDREYSTLTQTVPAQNIYFASCATDVFEAQDGHFKLIARFPIEGYLYDGSPI